MEFCLFGFLVIRWLLVSLMAANCISFHCLILSTASNGLLRFAIEKWMFGVGVVGGLIFVVVASLIALSLFSAGLRSWWSA